jgi:hypothetical protein
MFLYLKRSLTLTLSSTSAHLPNGCEVPPALRLGSLPPQSSRFCSLYGQVVRYAHRPCPELHLSLQLPWSDRCPPQLWCVFLTTHRRCFSCVPATYYFLPFDLLRVIACVALFTPAAFVSASTAASCAGSSPALPVYT